MHRRALFEDPTSDIGGDAADLFLTTVLHDDGANPGSAADDEIYFSSIFINAGLGLLPGDVVWFYVNSDGNAGTGPAIVPTAAFGADYLLEFINVGGSLEAALLRWDAGASQFLLVRELFELQDFLLTDNFGGGFSKIETLSLRPEELGLSRGETFTTLVRSAWDATGTIVDEDIAPNAPPFYPLTIPPPPERPGLAVAAPTGITTSSATLNGTVQPEPTPDHLLLRVRAHGRLRRQDS